MTRKAHDLTICRSGLLKGSAIDRYSGRAVRGIQQIGKQGPVDIAREKARQFALQPALQTPGKFRILVVFRTLQHQAPSSTLRRVSLARACLPKRARKVLS